MRINDVDGNLRGLANRIQRVRKRDHRSRRKREKKNDDDSDKEKKETDESSHEGRLGCAAIPVPQIYSSTSGAIWMFFSPAARFSQYLRTQASKLLPAAGSRSLNFSAAISE